MGSVLGRPLVDHGEYTLWLEYVVNKKDKDEFYWLMWYKSGVPTIPMSGVLSKNDLSEILKAFLDAKDIN
jgi:hypothetical protein